MGSCCIPQALVQERLEQEGPATISVFALPPVTSHALAAFQSNSSRQRAGDPLCWEARKEAGRHDFSSRLQPLLFPGQDL